MTPDMTDKPNGQNDGDKDIANTEEIGADGPEKDSSEDALFEDMDIVAEPAATERRPGRLTALTAFIALLASVGALTGVAYVAFFAGEDTSANDAAEQRMAALSASIRSNESALADLNRQITQLESSGGSAVDIDAVERALQPRLEQRLELLESVPARVASIESALTALRGISTGARDAWLLAEAEYYMQIANAQLQLAGNPPLATLALELADERIVELGDPGLTDVRRALSDEIRELEVLENPDIEGATLTLASLSRVVDSLPIRRQILVEENDDPAVDAELSGTDRAVASLKNALSGVVSVRRTDEAARPLIAPEAVYFLRANLALQLQAARLAMLRGEQALFQQSLDDASAWLREYYDTESTPVRSALQTIGEIRESSFTRAMPDISGSLRLIREYLAFIEASRIEGEGTETEPAQ